MKRILALVLVLTLLFSFTACSKEPKKEFSRGVVTENTYENEFLGLGLKLNENWVFYTDEEIAALYGLTEEMLGDDFEEYLKNATVIYDMHVANKLDATNINLNFEKLSTFSNAQTANMEIFVSSIMPTVANSLESIGCTDVNYELCDIAIGDKTFNGARITAAMEGFQLYQTLVCIKCDGYIASICVTSYIEDAGDSAIKSFYILD